MVGFYSPKAGLVWSAANLVRGLTNSPSVDDYFGGSCSKVSDVNF